MGQDLEESEVTSWEQGGRHTLPPGRPEVSGSENSRRGNRELRSEHFNLETAGPPRFYSAHGLNIC